LAYVNEGTRFGWRRTRVHVPEFTHLQSDTVKNITNSTLIFGVFSRFLAQFS